jgi:hypothetical protein
MLTAFSQKVQNVLSLSHTKGLFALTTPSWDGKERRVSSQGFIIRG